MDIELVRLEKNANQGEILDFSQTADFLNLKPSRLRTLIFKKEIPVIRISRTLRFSRQDLMIWLNEKKS